jgi:hypothetical protein
MIDYKVSTAGLCHNIGSANVVFIFMRLPENPRRMQEAKMPTPGGVSIF